MTEIIGAGLDGDKLDLIQHEPEMDLKGDQDKVDNVDSMLDLDNDHLVMSSTIHYMLLQRNIAVLPVQAPPQILAMFSLSFQVLK